MSWLLLESNLLEWLRIDDPIGAVPVHGLCGIWGTWSLGLFACGKYNGAGSTGPNAIDKDHAALTGLFYQGGVDLLKVQIVGNLIMGLSAFAVAIGIMYAVKAMGFLRVSREGELEGLDIHEHGIPAYPEFELKPSPQAHGAAQ